MKKFLLIVLMCLSLSSCMMFPDKNSDQEIFYGESLAQSREIPKAKRINSSFTYIPEDDDEDCEECQIYR
ncbi:Uncharacterised protein [Anaerococcus octavius]|uniref:Lipoprotein n=1 Tax=Anaerococcus octavius TaxID=54007 RepID=A0A380WS81_9FIRM|nr:hypothetical protein [Anaerococcus octavius]MDU5230524.1 hypothetical protein [Anaerococcus sp.]SUU91796.1 Uncharacterised protein [Anaerococcus octavius]